MQLIHLALSLLTKVIFKIVLILSMYFIFIGLLTEHPRSYGGNYDYAFLFFIGSMSLDPRMKRD